MTSVKSSPIEVIPAEPHQQPVVANLLDLYMHDFSEFFDVPIGEDGRFHYPQIQLYWTEPGRHPFLVRSDGNLAGLVLVKRGSRISDANDVWDMAEFFVLRGYRRMGVGTRVAREVWARFPGRWEVRVMSNNAPALRFWAKAVAAHVKHSVDPVAIEKDGKSWTVYSFVVPSS